MSLGRKASEGYLECASSQSDHYSLASNVTYVFVLPSTTRSGVSPEMKSSSDGPCSSVSLKVSFGADDRDVAAGVASERICLDTETRATCEFLRMNDMCNTVDRIESFCVKYQ
jgi:hypothetical protein